MPADVCVLANGRTADQVERFLGHFLPRRREAASEYVVPQFAARPEAVLTDVGELLRLCQRRPELTQSVYWSHASPGGEPHSAHAFFLSDGGLVLGLSTADRDGGERRLSELMAFAGSRVGYITYEQPPGSTTTAF